MAAGDDGIGVSTTISATAKPTSGPPNASGSWATAICAASSTVSAGSESGADTTTSRCATSATAASVTRSRGRPSLAHDPQTSGGLLAAVSPDKLDAVVAALEARGVPGWLVGQVEAAGVAGPGVVLA